VLDSGLPNHITVMGIVYSGSLPIEAEVRHTGDKLIVPGLQHNSAPTEIGLVPAMVAARRRRRSPGQSCWTERLLNWLVRYSMALVASCTWVSYPVRCCSARPSAGAGVRFPFLTAPDSPSIHEVHAHHRCPLPPFPS